MPNLQIDIVNISVVPVSTVSMFENRFFVLFAEDTHWRYIRYLLLIFNYTIAIFSGMVTCLEIPDQQYARAIVFAKNSEIIQFDLPESPMFIISVYNPWITYRLLIYLALFVVELFVFTILIRMNMKKAMTGFRSTISQKTLKMHKNSIKAMNLQVAIPMLVICVPCLSSIIVPVFLSDHQGFINFTNIVVSSHGALSALLMIYLQTSYRAEVVRIVGCCRKLRIGEGVQVFHISSTS